MESKEYLLLDSDFDREIFQSHHKKQLCISKGYWRNAWEIIRSNKMAVLALGTLSVLILLCLIGPYLTPYSYEGMNPGNRYMSPSKLHWFGTDGLGRDLFTRIWMGGRISLALGLIGAAIDLIIGVIYGGISGYLGGRVDQYMMRIIEVLASIPYLVLVILISLIFGKGMMSLIIAMTLTGWCYMARLVRGQILQIKGQDYILAAQALGTSTFKIIQKHLLPNIMGVMIVAVTFDIPSFIFGEAFLSFIGLGIQAPMTSWGVLAAEAQGSMAFYPYLLFFPGLVISLTMLSFQLLGDGLRDALDPKLQK